MNNIGPNTHAHRHVLAQTLPAAPLGWVCRCHCRESAGREPPLPVSHPPGPHPLEQARGLAERRWFHLDYVFFPLIQLGVVLRGLEEESSLWTSLLSVYAVHAGDEKE